MFYVIIAKIQKTIRKPSIVLGFVNVQATRGRSRGAGRVKSGGRPFGQIANRRH